MTVLQLLHDLLDSAAARHGGRAAVRFGLEVVTYRELRERSERTAAWLLATGVRRGDRVLIALPPDISVVALLYACSRIGAVFIVLPSGTPPVVARHIVDDAQAALVLTGRRELADVAVERGIAHRGVDALREARTPMALPPSGPLPVDPACFIYTSGTTAMPKAVVCTHAQMTFAASAIQSQLEYRSDDVVYCALPLSFDYGLYQLFLCALSGAELRLASADEAGPRLVAELLSANASVLPAVPSLSANLARLLSRSDAALPRLRLLTNTGAAMPESLLSTLRARLPGLRIQLMYGLTECKRVTIMPKDEDLRRPGACGRALPGTEVLVVGSDGAPLPAGKVGEIVVRGANVMAGYWRRPELSAQRFPRAHGLFPELRTGDFGWLDPDGYLHFVGRRDDLYKERGFRVSTIEVEAAALRVPGVRAAAVVPPTTDEQGATLLVETDLAAHEVLRELRSQIDEVKVPARCIVVPQLPLNANGKVERSGLGVLIGGHVHA